MQRRREWGLLGAVLVLTTFAHMFALNASFQFDDWNVVVDAANVQSIAAWWHAMPGIRPLLKLSYALNHVWAPSPAGFRSINLLLHLCNVVAVHVLLRRAFPHQPGIALWTTVVFALHPAQTEAVTYISGRSVTLCASACLASLVAWQHSLDKPAKRHLATLCAVVCLALALMVKEFAVVVPLAAVLLVRAAHPETPWTAVVKQTAALWLTTVFMVGALLLLPRYHSLLATSWSHLTLQETVLTHGHAVRYLLEQLWRIGRLNADPALAPLSSLDDTGAWDWLLMTAIASCSIAAWWRGYRAAWGAVWFFVWLLPTHSLLARLDVANDRQLYLAMIGPVWLAGDVVSRGFALAQKQKHSAIAQRLAPLFIASVALGLALATARRAEVYRDEVSYWTDVIEKSPHNARAYTNIGYAYAERCQLEQAQHAWRRALSLAPEDSKPAVNLQLLNEGQLRLSGSRLSGDCPTAIAP